MDFEWIANFLEYLERSFIMHGKQIMAAVLTCGLFLGSINPASAGGWQLIEPDWMYEGSPEWQAMTEERVDGIIGYSITRPTGTITYSEQWKDVGAEAAGFVGMSSHMFYEGTDGPATTYANGQRRWMFRWIPDTDPLTGLPDVNDTPPSVLKLKLDLWARSHIDGDTSLPFNTEASVAGVYGTTTTGLGYKESSARKIFLIHILTRGQYEVWTPYFNFHAQQQIAFVNTTEFVSMDGWFVAGISEDFRKVEVTSSSDPTYFKSTSLDGHDSPELRTGVPVASGQPYSIKHKRATDGSMTADKAADWKTVTLDSSQDGWYAGGEYTANATAFTTPTYEWEVTGGTPSSWATDTINAGTSSISFPNTIAGVPPVVNGIKISSDDEPPSPIGQTVFKVKVTDTDGVFGENTYTVNWHNAFENVVLYDTQNNGYVDVNLMPKPGTSAYVDPGETAYGIIDPDELIMNVAGAPAVGLILGGGAYFVAPSRLLAAAVSASGTTLTHIVPIAEERSLDNSYVEWSRAVTDTQENTGNDFIYPKELVDSHVLTDALTDTVWPTCGMSIVCRREYKKKLTRWDTYDASGYNGLGFGTGDFPGNYTYLGYYTHSSEQNNP